MSKMKKTRRDLVRLEKYLSREIERIDKLAARRKTRKSDGTSLAGQVIGRLMARKSAAEADLQRVADERARLGGSEETAPTEAETSPEPDPKPARKPRKPAASAPAETSAVRANGTDKA